VFHNVDEKTSLVNENVLVPIYICNA
jgi:hypothetical protein